MVEKLKKAAEEVDKQRALVEQEMAERGNKGHLWHNGMCKAWPDYEKAISVQAELRAKFGV
jgi:hypothetical protein